NMVMVIADDASYVKDFMLPAQVANAQQVPTLQLSPTPAPSSATLDDLQNQAKQYLEYVPFENVTSKIFTLTNGVRAYATNQDIFEGIREVLEKQGFVIDAVIPQFAFEPEFGNKVALDGQVIAVVLQKLDMLNEYNLLRINGSMKIVETAIAEEHEETEEKASKPASKENNRLVLLVAAVILFLIVFITGWILYQQFTTKPYNSPVNVLQPPVKSVGIAPSTPIISLTPAVTVVKELTVQIVVNQATAAKAETVKSILSKYGFKSITVQTQDTLAAAQNSVTFSPKVGTQEKLTVTNDLKNALGEVLVQEKSDAVFDIGIVIEK
ncbi:MAG TPA: hypothetical protein VF810_05325, partial [Patescibacteria group bacterium]